MSTLPAWELPLRIHWIGAVLNAPPPGPPIPPDPPPGPPSKRDLLEIQFGVLGAVGLILGATLPVIAELELQLPAKMLWIGCVVVMACLFGLALYGSIVARIFPHSQRIGRWLRFTGLVAAILVGGAVVFISGSFAATISRTCLAPGEGGGEYERAFIEAFDRNGGIAELGCPITPVRTLLGGYHQNLSGHPNGPGVIFAVSPDQAVALDPDEWLGYHQIQGPVESTVAAGYPYEDAVSLRDGKYMELGAGDDGWSRSAIVKTKQNRWFWIQGGMWEGYRDRFGGPEGSYGYPIAEQELTSKGKSQQFENGRLYFSLERGVQTQEEFDVAASGLPEDDIGIGNGSSKIVYRVDSSGGTSHEIPEGAYVEQTFQATTPIIDKVGAIVGLDPNNASNVAHRLLFRLLDGDKDIIEPKPVDLVNNELTSTNLPPVEVEIGKVYTLRVVNLSKDVLGFYLNEPGRSNQQADETARARLVGELVMPEPYTHPDHALSALVQGRGP